MFGDPFSMVVAIVLIVAVAGVLRARFEHGRAGAPSDADVDSLRAELRAVKERIAVLERLATDDGAALNREFARLRGDEGTR